MKPYKDAVRVRIQVLLDAGLSQREVAEQLEFDNPNNISMLMSDRYPTTVLAPAKLPLLERACRLTACQALGLFRLYVASAPGDSKSMHLDLETCDWLIRTTVRAKSEFDARRCVSPAPSAHAAVGAAHV